MSTVDFVDSIQDQSIFKRYLDSNKTTHGNKLVINHNCDIFYAVENVIRCCTINSTTKNYRIIESPFRAFDIDEISINESGTYLYTTDYQRVVIHSIPDNLSLKDHKVLPNENYELEGIDTTIKKIIWFNLLPRQSGLVILDNNNGLKVYDFANSSKPMINLDLNKYFNQPETISSISFGSEINLIGAMTLYLTTESSKIYAIYPLLYKDCYIATTTDAITTVKNETEEMLQYIKSKYPERDELLSLVEHQLNIFQYLYEESSDSTASEYRVLRNDESLLFKKIKISMHLKTPYIQGPLINLSMGKINDICHIGSNKNLSVLSIINDDANDLMIKYLVQLKPLVMRWESEASTLISRVYDLSVNETTVTPSIPTPLQIPKQINHVSYQTPTKGFGYVDEDEDEDSEPETGSETSLETLEAPSEGDETTSESKLLFWRENFIGIDEVSIDILNDVKLNKERKIIPSNINNYQFLIHSSDITIIITPNDWIKLLANYLIDADNKFEIYNDYQLIDHVQGGPSSVSLIKDDITFTGNYLISAPLEKDNKIEIVQIEKPHELLINNSEEMALIKESSPIIINPRSHDTLVEELEILTKNLKALTTEGAIEKNDDDLKVLSKVNEFSIKSIDQISEYSKILIKLGVKISNSIKELQNQFDIYNTTKSVVWKQERIEKMDNLKEKQIDINNRLKILHKKLIIKIEEIKIYKKVPLSQSEKKWFEEINQITGDESIFTKFSDLQNQVKLIKDSFDLTKIDSKNTSIKDLNYIKRIFSEQKLSLNNLKQLFDDLIKDLDNES